MSKNKTFIIIMTVMILVLLAMGGFYFYLSNAKNAAVNSATTSGGNTSGTISNPSRPVTIAQPSSGTIASSTSPTTVSSTGAMIPDLRQISSTASAGGTFFDVATTTLGPTGKKVPSTMTMIRYMEKATGHIFETDVSDLAIKLISDTNIPLVRQAFWQKDGSAVYAQYFDSNDTIQTYYGKLVPAQNNLVTATSTDIQYANMQLQGSFLPTGILAFNFSPAKTSIFYLTGTAGLAQGMTAKLDGTQKVQIFSSPLTEWASSWVAPTTIALNTKPSGTTSGFLYFLNTSNGLLTKILGNIAGLTSLTSVDSKNVLFSQSEGSSFSTNLYTLSTNAVTNFPVTTLPEKCVWSSLDTMVVYCAVPEQIPQGLYPDAWYQGIVSFTDDIEKIDISTGSVIVLAKPSEMVGVSMDAVDLSLDSKEDNLLFTNKKDGTLWDLNIVQ